MDKNILRAIQHHAARAAIGSSSMRGAGSAGVVMRSREFLGDLQLRQFGTSRRNRFAASLDSATRELQQKLPKGAQRWGLARKALNLFLRNCLYTCYLREEYRLDRAEAFFEVPLDSITGKHLVVASGGELPRWRTVRGLTPAASAQYQTFAALLAAHRGHARVHLDALWWGERAPE
jgi:hypothetical protein